MFAQHERQYGLLVHGFFDRHKACGGAVEVSPARHRSRAWRTHSRGHLTEGNEPGQQGVASPAAPEWPPPGYLRTDL